MKGICKYGFVISVLLAVALFLLSCSKKESPLSRSMVRISQISELGTVEYKIRKVVKADDVGQWYKVGERKILFACSVYIKAGVDLVGFSEKDVEVSADGKDVVVYLPHAKILSFNMPSSEVQVVYDQVSGLRSSFTASELNAILREGERQVRDDIPSMDILSNAEARARRYFEVLLLDMGYESVAVQFRD